MSGTNIGETEDYWRKRIEVSTGALLDRLKEHHDYSVLYRPNPVAKPIEIASSEETQQIEICVLPIDNKPPTVEAIKRVVCRHFGLSHHELLSDRRHVDVVRPRHIVMYLSREITGLSFPQIGRRLGRKDHTTIMHGANKIAELLKTDSKLADDVAQIEAQL